MNCQDAHEHLSSFRQGEIAPDLSEELAAHLEGCPDCTDLLTALDLISEAGETVSSLEPPPDLADRLTSSPCQRWLDLLFKAVDRELSEAGLTRLLPHLEACEGCRRAWNDLTLMHQVTDALSPPSALLQRCINVRRSAMRPRVLGRKTVIAAAYVLALLIGPPVTLARHEAAFVVQRVASTVSVQLSEVAADGRGEARVMMWRTWLWVRDKIDATKKLFENLDDPELENSEAAQEASSHGKPDDA